MKVFFFIRLHREPANLLGIHWPDQVLLMFIFWDYSSANLVRSPLGPFWSFWHAEREVFRLVNFLLRLKVFNNIFEVVV